MKVLAINGSPRMDQGNTAMVLGPFLEGIGEAGAEVELFYTKRLNINPCQGELNCFFKTPGNCFQTDDMEMLRPRLRDADMWVLATPVYLDGVTGPMKNLMDRTLPLMQPFLEMRDGHSRHPLWEGVKRGKLVLVSCCGLCETDNFDPMLTHMKAFCKNLDREFAGAVLRPNGGFLKEMVEMGMPLDDVFGAAREAGRQLIRDGRMSAETLGAVGRELMTPEAFMEVANPTIQQMLDAAAQSQ
jgi:multimeric flavodoxin WrbA